MSLKWLLISLCLAGSFGAHLQLVGAAPGCEPVEFAHKVSLHGKVVLMNDSGKRGDNKVSYLMSGLYDKLRYAASLPGNHGYVTSAISVQDVYQAIKADAQAQVSRFATKSSKIKQIEAAKQMHIQDCANVLLFMGKCQSLVAAKVAVNLKDITSTGMRALAQAEFCAILKSNSAQLDGAYEELKSKYSSSSSSGRS